MGIKEYEKAIIEKLGTEITDLKVEGFPDKPKAYNSTTKGEILVRYHGGKRGEVITNPAQFVSHKKKVQFFVSVSLTDLRTHTGVYDYLDKIEDILSGYKIPDKSVLTKVYPVNDDFIDWSENKWTYGIVFEFEILKKERQ